MNRIIYIFIFCVSALYSQAQKETNNWFFGNRVGLTWNTTRSVEATGVNTTNATLTGLPTNVSGSVMDMSEGCFSLSDENGNLLFYSNGMEIYDRRHQPMPNGTGMTGDQTSAQSGIIMPYPGSSVKYLLVSIQPSATNVMCYSVVDMTLNGGYGDVVATEKNIPFTGQSGLLGESVTSILYAANGIDVWIVAPGKGNSSYLNAWLVTESGVSTTPKKTQLPVAVTCTTSGTPNGYIKFSPDSKYFVWATKCTDNIFIGKFNNATGYFSDIKTVSPPGEESSKYGVEFSPSGKYMYCSETNSPNVKVWDFETLISAANPNTVPYQKIDLTGNMYSGAAQLGPDGRIYIAASGGNFLFVIDNPEEYNNLRVYRLPAGFLNGNCRLGLPSFSASWFSAAFEGETSFCLNTLQTFTLRIKEGTGTDQISHTEWDFGDGSTIFTDDDMSGVQSHDHTYKKKGVYTITIKAFRVSDGTEVTGLRQRIKVVVASCSLPVNHNVSTMENF